MFVVYVVCLNILIVLQKDYPVLFPFDDAILENFIHEYSILMLK